MNLAVIRIPYHEVLQHWKLGHGEKSLLNLLVFLIITVLFLFSNLN